jgi:lysine 2,3-aminomutase
MAGLTNQGDFSEKISPFLRKKMELLRNEQGENSGAYRALYLQYVKQGIELAEKAESNNRHWEADIKLDVSDVSANFIHGVERLYRQSIVIEPTMICAAHCRYCLRANYDIFTLSESELKNIAIYCGCDSVKNEVSEVLITGGDPFIVPQKLRYLIENIIEFAPNIKRVRIGTRVPLHDPDRVDNNIFEIFNRHRNKIKFEVATQINHATELFPEVIEKFVKIREMGITVYAQNVILKGVNDNLPTLIDLYSKMREVGIESHYLFHSVPMRGMHHFRTSVKKGLELSRELTNSGVVSGRVKPMYALMTDIGKVTLYDGTILEHDNGQILIQSDYRYTDRMKWNPDWQLPSTAFVDEGGFLRVWYLDGNDYK